MKKTWTKLLPIVIFITFFLSSCKGKPVQDSKKLEIYSSFYPIYDMTKEIAGDKLEIKSFMPIDKDAHDWEPSAKDIKNLSEASLFFINGANMEPWLSNIQENIPDLKIVDLSKDINLIPANTAAIEGNFNFMSKFDFNKETYSIEFGHTHKKVFKVGFLKTEENDLEPLGKEIMSQEGVDVKNNSTIKVESNKLYNIELEHSDGKVLLEFPEAVKWTVFADQITDDALPYAFFNSNGKEIKLENLATIDNDLKGYDPHSWLSLNNAKYYVNRISQSLSEIDPDNAEFYTENSKAYIDKITNLENKYKEKFHDKKTEYFIVPHQAFGYLARDFGLKQYPLQKLTSTADPSLKTMQEAIHFCKEHNINTIFYEYGESDKIAQTLASEINGVVKPLSSIEFEAKDSGESYLELMEMNLNNISESMN